MSLLPLSGLPHLPLEVHVKCIRAPQEQWTGDFLELFSRESLALSEASWLLRRRNLLVAMSAYHSFQVRWLLGLRGLSKRWIFLQLALDFIGFKRV